MGTKKYLTVQIIPDGLGKTLAFRINYTYFRIFLVVAIILGIALTLGIIKFSEINLKAFTADDLAKQNLALKNNQAIIDSLAAEIQVLENKSQKIENVIRTFLAPQSVAEKSLTPGKEKVLIAAQEIDKYLKSIDTINTKAGQTKNPLYIPNIWPVHGILSQEYSQKHPALDIVASLNSLVTSTAKGTVVKSEWDRDLGNFVLIEHKGEYQTLYAHLNRALVKMGDPVEKGAGIGTLGNTGNSSAPHLHYEILQNEININPKLMLPK